MDKIKKDIKKVKNIKEIQEEVEWMLSDILNYMQNNNTEGLTTQSEIGMRNLFRGWITKNWRDVNSRSNEKQKEINKILVRNSVTFYSEAWKKRNEVMHDPEKYKLFICN